MKKKSFKVKPQNKTNEWGRAAGMEQYSSSGWCAIHFTFWSTDVALSSRPSCWIRCFAAWLPISWSVRSGRSDWCARWLLSCSGSYLWATNTKQNRVNAWAGPNGDVGRVTAVSAVHQFVLVVVVLVVLVVQVAV